MRDTRGREWFSCPFEHIENVIFSLLDGSNAALSAAKARARREFAAQRREHLVLRPEQERVVREIAAFYRTIPEGCHAEYLLDAKPRFGKTVTAYSLVKEVAAERVLVITHRPTVLPTWAGEIGKVLGSDYQLVSKKNIEGAVTYWMDEADLTKPHVIFLSMQDARGKENTSEDDTGEDEDIVVSEQQFKQANKDIFKQTFDIVLVDESHEGNDTDLAREVYADINRRMTLHLTATPFKMRATTGRFTDENASAWTYVDEQRAKRRFYLDHPEEPNPYALLPLMHMHIISINQSCLVGQDGEFAFERFFAVDDRGDFVHDTEVDAFLDNISDPTRDAMPYSDHGAPKHRHAMWKMPSVDACHAMKRCLEDHTGFRDYETLVVAGSSGLTWTDNHGSRYTTAEEMVNGVIGERPWETQTIILTVDRLTTGSTIPALSSVLMLQESKAPRRMCSPFFVVSRRANDSRLPMPMLTPARRTRITCSRKRTVMCTTSPQIAP